MTRLEPLLEYIQLHHGEELPLDEAVDFMGLNKEYFCRLFKTVMGVTPIRYQTENRLRLADIFLAEGSHTVADIAHMVGFDDAAYFSRCYKKYRGFPPRGPQTP